MNEYVKQAKDFLESCNATMDIKYVGIETPNWDGKGHRAYDCTIKTPRGEMKVHFYDSLNNTEIHNMTVDKYIENTYKYRASDAPYNVKIKAMKALAAKKAEAVPTEYDILACLQKYDVGDMDNFMAEFGYEIKCTKDMTNFINTYNEVVKEYNDVRRCFTPEQIEAMCEIQ
jgi:hypothetical protein